MTASLGWIFLNTICCVSATIMFVIQADWMESVWYDKEPILGSSLIPEFPTQKSAQEEIDSWTDYSLVRVESENGHSYEYKVLLNQQDDEPTEEYPAE